MKKKVLEISEMYEDGRDDPPSEKNTEFNKIFGVEISKKRDIMLYLKIFESEFKDGTDVLSFSIVENGEHLTEQKIYLKG